MFSVQWRCCKAEVPVVFVCGCMCIYTDICIDICFFICTDICIFVCICFCICTDIYNHISLYLSLDFMICSYLSLDLHWYLHSYLFVFVFGFHDFWTFSSICLGLSHLSANSLEGKLWISQTIIWESTYLKDRKVKIYWRK